MLSRCTNRHLKVAVSAVVPAAPLAARTGSVVPSLPRASRGLLASVRISREEFSAVLGDALQRVISGDRNGLGVRGLGARKRGREEGKQSVAVDVP